MKNRRATCCDPRQRYAYYRAALDARAVAYATCAGQPACGCFDSTECTTARDAYYRALDDLFGRKVGDG